MKYLVRYGLCAAIIGLGVAGFELGVAGIRLGVVGPFKPCKPPVMIILYFFTYIFIIICK